MAESAMERREDKPKDSLAFAALTAFVAAMYAVPGEWIAALESWRIALVTSTLAAVLMGMRRLGRREPLVLDGHRGGALLALTLLAFASMTWSVAPEVSRFTAIELGKLTAIYITMVNVVTTPRRLAIICGALVLSSIFTSIGVIDWYLTGVDLVEGFRARWVGVYADPNHMAMDMLIVVPIAVAFIARKESGWFLRLLCLAAAGLAVTAIVVSHSRGGFIGLAIAMALWAIREKRRLQAVLVGALLLVGLALFAPSSFWKRNETVTTYEQDASAMGRVYAWRVAAEINKDRPLLGVGAGSFLHAWFDYAPPEATEAYVAHNVFLDVLGELGFIGLLFFLVFSGSAVGGAFEVASRSNLSWMARGLASAAAGYLICDLFSGYLLSAHFYVLLGLAACVSRLARAEEATAVEPVVGRGVSATSQFNGVIDAA